VWDTRDPQVVRAYLILAPGGDTDDPSAFQWVTGRPQIAAWAAARFAQRHHYAVGAYRAAGDTVAWPYQEFVDPVQRLPGVGPVEGTAEAVVRGGTITRLTFVQSPESVRRQRSEVDAASARAEAIRRAVPPGDGPGVPPREPRGGAAAEPTGAAWPLALGGLAALGAVAVALRRRRLPPP
jgi:hypothetical protein